MSLDRRLVKLRSLWELDDTTFPRLTDSYDEWLASSLRVQQRVHLVDPLLEETRGLAPVFQSGGVITGRPALGGTVELGRGWSSGAPACAKPIPQLSSEQHGGPRPGGGLPLAIQTPPIYASRADTDQEIVVDGTTTTHTLHFATGAGGHLRSWTVDGPLGALQIINHNNGWKRGGQFGLEWCDAESGEITRHVAVQGGNVYAGPPENAQLAFGGVMHREMRAVRQGITAVIQTGPVTLAEFDPDGSLSIPGVSSYHYGAKGEPVLWRDLTIEQSLHINYMGRENLHALETRLILPFGIRTAFFDLERYHMLSLRDDLFGRVQTHHLGDALTTELSDGTPGAPFYGSDFQRYCAFSEHIVADDVGRAARSMFEKRMILGACGPTDADLAVVMGAVCMSQGEAQPRSNMGNCMSWTQTRGGTGGASGTNCVVLSHGSRHTSLVHSPTNMRFMAPGIYTMRTWLTTTSWDDALPLLGTVLG